jgi:hypothetical protein
MATMDAMLGFLRVEVEGLIESIVPVSQTVKRFRARSIESRDMATFQETPGEDRMFEMNFNIANMQTWFTGCDVHGYTFDLPILVGYGDAVKWSRAGIDDFNQISEVLRKTGTAVAGVHIREINDEFGFQLIPATADQWQVGQMLLRVHLEATTS